MIPGGSSARRERAFSGSCLRTSSPPASLNVWRGATKPRGPEVLQPRQGPRKEPRKAVPSLINIPLLLLLNKAYQFPRRPWKFETKYPKFAPIFAPKFLVLLLTGRKVFPRIPRCFPSDRNISNFESNVTQKLQSAFL